MMYNTCALYGVTNYTNSWLNINILLLLTILMISGMAYAISNILSSDAREKIKGIVRFEILQSIISAFIIAILLGSALVACNVSAQVSSSLAHTQMGPFQYADYYIGTISLNQGLSLLTQVYATSVTYSIYATVISSIPTAFNIGPGAINLPKSFSGAWMSFTGLSGLKVANGYITITPKISQDASYMFSTVSGMFFDVFSPLVIIPTSLLFIQFLLIPIIQYTAFVIVIPVAIAMRSLAFASNSLRDTSNSFIAIAVALYIVYPMMIAFNSYAIGWIFSASNPSYVYASSAFTQNKISVLPFFSQAPMPGGLGSIMSSLSSFFGQVSGLTAGNYVPPVFLGIGPASFLDVPMVLKYYIDTIARFAFTSLMMFVLDFAVTIGFAIGLYNALKSTLGNRTGFW